ncbi:MAG: M42 family metallopeptidase [Archaeoglobaceae archaeon]|nr:M42 family metallopeptidase [Archaeoglobaceae archaeon]MCX8152020.1 M42 family metallopeptidase [Archaeoglobaceae archaeon]MDW8013409.1 M42 family metallopeptidase [Archaeoglobaceae archaeon]
MFELIKKLSNALGVSGYEEDVKEIVKAELENYVDEIKTDSLGNLICVKNGSERMKIMVAAHVDEIGFVVKHIDDKGFIRLTPIGGHFSQIVLGQRVVIYGKSKIYGVIGCKPPHLMKDEERKKAIEISDMFVDVGASSKEEVLKLGIEVGSPAVLDREVVMLANNRITGKAFDNRVGVAVMIEAVKRTESDATVFAVATVQEEVGLKGARTCAYALDPNLAIALDTCPAADFPGSESAHMDIRIGKGAAITVIDAAGRGLITTPKVLKWLRETAEKYNIPYQLEVAEGGTTDASAISLTKQGIPAGVVSVPARYIHSPVEVVDLRDCDSAANLVAKALETYKDYWY